MNEFDTLLRSAVNRRAFLTRMSAAGLGTVAAALLAGCGGATNPSTGGGGGTVLTPGGGTPTPTPTPTPTTTFFDATNFPGVVGRNYNEVVLNFALTLEILEADLYRQALNLASGRALSTALDATVPASGSTGAYTQTVGNGSIASTLAAPAFLYLVQYSYVEAAHRDFLRVVLSSLNAPVAPANPLGYTTGLTTSATLSDIMKTILIAEEEGTRAYHGAAGYMTDFTLLTNAAAIYSTECRHSAAVNYVLGNDIGPAFRDGDTNVTGAVGTNPVSNNLFEYLRPPATVLKDVQGFIVKA